MTAALSVTSPAAPATVARVRGAGFDPARKVQLALDGSGYTTNYFRPQDDGTFQVGMLVGSKARTSTITARYAGSSAIVATVSLVIAAPAPTPTPAPTPPPVTPPAGLVWDDWQAAVNAAKPGATLDFTGTFYDRQLTVTSKTRLTIVGGELRGRGGAFEGILLDRCTDVRVSGVHVIDCTYAGIMVLSGLRVGVVACTIERIAVPQYIAAIAAGGPGAWNMNAYGIAFTDTNGTPSKDCWASLNIIDQVPSWHGIDTHGGDTILIEDNIIHRTNRAIFITDSSVAPRNIVLNRNVMDTPMPRPDVAKTYPYNEVAVTLYRAAGVSGMGNIADGWPSGNHLDNLGKTSTNVTVQVTTRNPK